MFYLKQFEDALDEISDESPQTEIQHLNVKDESVKKLSKREKSVKRGDFNDNSHQVCQSNRSDLNADLNRK